MTRIILLLTILLAVSGCAQYSLIDAGPQTIGSMNVNTQSKWNKAAYNVGPKTTLWTKDGAALNQLVFFDGIESRKPIMRSYNKELPLPEFRADMLPNELAELVETSVRNINGGAVEARSSNLRPQQLGEDLGFRFDLNYFTVDGLSKSGEVIAVVKDAKLYMILFDAATLHYQPKDAVEINTMFSGLSL